MLKKNQPPLVVSTLFVCFHMKICLHASTIVATQTLCYIYHISTITGEICYLLKYSRYTIYIYRGIYIYIYGTCAWTPNNILWALMVVEPLLCNFKWKSKHPLAHHAKKNWVGFELRHLGLGTWPKAGLGHLGLGTWADTQWSWNTSFGQLGLGTQA